MADLDQVWDDYRYTGRHDRTRAELDAVRAIRPRLRALLTADRDGAVGLVNEMLSEARAVPQLIRHGDSTGTSTRSRWTQPLDTRILVETAMAMIDVIRADEMSRLGRLRRQRLRGRGARPLPQPLPAVLLHHLRQPQRRGGLPGPRAW